MNTETKRVLYVSYLFPPVGGVGVMRAMKFVKFLPEYGWDVTVLTAGNPSVPLRDESLLKQIPPQTVIRTAKTWEPNYALKKKVASADGAKPGLIGQLKSRLKRIVLAGGNMVLQPDTRILWYRQAVREGLRVLSGQPFDAIVATAPPFTSLLVGAALAKKSGVPLVLDYRDEWSISNANWEHKHPGRFGNWVQGKMEKSALRAAHTIVATTPGSASAVGEIAASAGSRAVSTHIFNGFDPSDFPANDESLEREDFGHGVDRFRISFVGTLWALTSIEPFVRAIEKIAQESPQLLEQLEVVIAGRQVGQQLDHLETLKSLPCKVSHLGFLEHKQALRLMATSDWLMQLQSDLPGVERVISCKVFEYMGLDRPVLSITPEGDQCDVLRRWGGATICYPDDPAGIATAVSERLRQQGDVTQHGDGVPSERSGADVSAFERRQLTGQLVDLLDGIRRERQVEAPNKSAQRPVVAEEVTA